MQVFIRPIFSLATILYLLLQHGIHAHDSKHESTTTDERTRHQHSHVRGLRHHHGGAPCGTHVSPEHQRLMEDAQMAWVEGNRERARRLQQGQRELFQVEVPVYFHVILKPNGSGSLKAAQRTAIMNRLNTAYASTGFSFVHQGTDQTASGVNGAVNACFDDATLRKFRVRKHRGGANALNVVICDTTTKDPDLTGFATLPPSVLAFDIRQDGITVAHPDDYSLLDTQETMIHETAHWLGLLHTFTSPKELAGNENDGCNTTPYRRENQLYYLTNDGIADTPNHAGPSLYQACAFKNCCLNSNRVSTLDTCPSLPGKDPVKNFMNYMPAECMRKHGEFTPNQVTRMIAQYETFRSPTRPINCGCPKSCTAEELAKIAVGDWTCGMDIVDGLSYYGNELSACKFTGSYYSQCSACNPDTCAALEPAPQTLSHLACAKRIKQKCNCLGTATCQYRIIRKQCYPSDFSTYKSAAIAELKGICGKRKRQNT